MFRAQRSTNLDQAFFHELRFAVREAGHGRLLQGSIKGGQNLVTLRRQGGEGKRGRGIDAKGRERRTRGATLIIQHKLSAERQDDCISRRVEMACNLDDCINRRRAPL